MLSPLTPQTPPTSCLQTPAPSTDCLCGSYFQDLTLSHEHQGPPGSVCLVFWSWALLCLKSPAPPHPRLSTQYATIHFPPEETAFGLCASFTLLWRLPTEVAITRLVCHTDNCSLGINFPQQAPDFHFYSNNRNTS